MNRTTLEKGLLIAGSLVIAAVFAYAGFNKITDPSDFADNIFGFAILPPALINLLALALPPFELGLATLLLIPYSRRIGALAAMLLTLIFCAVLLSALLRGLTLDCGCFGVGAPSRARMWVELGLDIVLLGSASLVYWRSLV
ncbi:MAG TPA: MauE/DoxX family redox-associated membrane protein [Candidatus Binataceae bacterium]|nr:MauE/DoxX family redox-associated membrane protein [Candidatus Binataceae bacterium]